MTPKRPPPAHREPTFGGPFRVMVFGLLVAGLIALAHGTETGQPPPASAETDTAAFAAEIGAFGRDLERLRRFMGAPKVSTLDIGIRDPLPRDLYFQALTLWEQTDRLSFEILRAHAGPSPAPTGAIGSQDALKRLQDAHQQVRQIMQQLQITAVGDPAEENGAAKLDYFNALLHLSRQLNLLLERHISPSDVYQQVTLAIGYSARLLARYPDAIRIPAEPPFEPDRQPGDVYLRLIECLQGIVRIFDRQGLPVLKIDTRQTDPDRLEPGDVYPIATLIVSQLDFLHQHLGITQPPPQPVYPGLKFPAHTYQRAAILQAQLHQLERFLPSGQATIPMPNSP
ncbi:MAG: hypothetical protein P9F19_00940 [Candidatus Contendobacter sp.]|nr:hypothetical protein [Candidatus Contendobacter sp.]MDG4555954.1 hypothetical protein [Candidatus Contendobacter sp.]